MIYKCLQISLLLMHVFFTNARALQPDHISQTNLHGQSSFPCHFQALLNQYLCESEMFEQNLNMTPLFDLLPVQPLPPIVSKDLHVAVPFRVCNITTASLASSPYVTNAQTSIDAPSSSDTLNAISSRATVMPDDTKSINHNNYDSHSIAGDPSLSDTPYG